MQRRTTPSARLFGLPPIDFETDVDLDLGGALDIAAFLDALNAGTVDGMFATQTSLASAMMILGIEADFAIDLTLDNGPTPPVFDEDLLSFCGEYFDEQGTALYHGLNSKSTYLLTRGDDPVDPLAVSLAELGAVPGDTLRLTRWEPTPTLTLLRDGDETRVAGVFSATDTVLPSSEDASHSGRHRRRRELRHAPYWSCILHLLLPAPRDRHPGGLRNRSGGRRGGARRGGVPDRGPDRPRICDYEDNSGLGFGVDIEVNPGASPRRARRRAAPAAGAGDGPPLHAHGTGRAGWVS